MGGGQDRAGGLRETVGDPAESRSPDPYFGAPRKVSTMSPKSNRTTQNAAEMRGSRPGPPGRPETGPGKPGVSGARPQPDRQGLDTGGDDRDSGQSAGNSPLSKAVQYWRAPKRGRPALDQPDGEPSRTGEPASMEPPRPARRPRGGRTRWKGLGHQGTAHHTDGPLFDAEPHGYGVPRRPQRSARTLSETRITPPGAACRSERFRSAVGTCAAAGCWSPRTRSTGPWPHPRASG